MTGGEGAICLVLDGGLANQLFQRAAAYVIAGRTGREVLLSAGWLGTGRLLGVTPRALEIPHRVDDLTRTPVPPRLLVNAARRAGRVPRAWLIESGPDDDALSLVAPETRWVIGFFQRASYVAEAMPRMRLYLSEHLQTRALLEPAPVPGVVVHVRLGDYVTNPTAAKAHGVPDPGYFVRGIQRLIDEGARAQVTLVSDDPPAALGRLREAGLPSMLPVTVSQNVSPWGDLALLAGADAVVMSNSSFSWWGAYLAYTHHRAPVVCPPAWFAVPTMPYPPLILQDWIVGT